MKRLLSIVLAAFMLAAIIPFNAFAASESFTLPISGFNYYFDYDDSSSLDGAIAVYPNDTDTARVIASDEYNFRYTYLLVCDQDGRIIQVGNNLLSDAQDPGGAFSPHGITVPAGGFAVAFFYNDNNNANAKLMGLYNEILALFTSDGAAIYNTVVSLDDCYYSVSYNNHSATFYRYLTEIDSYVDILIDGDISDSGWKEDGWITVDFYNGFLQESSTYSEAFSYKYQLRTDGEKLYAAFEIDCGAVGTRNSVALKINTNEEATVTTHKYYVSDLEAYATYNTSTTQLRMQKMPDSSMASAIGTVGEKKYIEFSADLSEFGGENGFAYYVYASNIINTQALLYYPAMTPGETNRGENVPDVNWDRSRQGYMDAEGNNIVPEDLVITLGEHKHSMSVGCEAFESSLEFVPFDGTLDFYEDANIYLTEDVYLQDYNASLYVASNVELNLCLNGYSIYGADNSPAIIVGRNATLNICDCSADQSGAITHYYNTDGYICNGSGIYVEYSGVLEMYGGNIRGNYSADGAGVYLDYMAEFHMYGGSIHDNEAEGSGGGIYAGDASYVVLNGGSIENNTAGSYGGAICYEGDLTIRETTINGNISYDDVGGGIYQNGDEYFTEIGGSAINITGNHADGGRINSNFDIMEHLYVSAPLDPEATVIGITANRSDCVAVPSGKVDALDDYASCFVCDDPEQVITVEKGYLYTIKVEKPSYGHTHMMSVNCEDGPGSLEFVPFSVYNENGNIEIYDHANIYLTQDVYLNDSIYIFSGAEVNLCLNGYSIYGAEGCSTILVDSDSVLNICDCSADQSGAVTHREPMMGLYESAGIAVLYSGILKMYGGSICNNYGWDGGGIYLNQLAQFYMYGGSVNGNEAYSSGGGIYSDYDAMIYLYGGSIVNNTAYDLGGAIYSYGYISINKTTITGNVCDSDGGGAIFQRSGYTNLGSGKINITENYADGGNTLSNFYVREPIFVDAPLDSETVIGISAPYADCIALHTDESGHLGEYISCFTSDSPERIIVAVDGDLYAVDAISHYPYYEAPYIELEAAVSEGAEYQWYINGEIAEGETSNSIVPKFGECYDCYITLANGAVLEAYFDAMPEIRHNPNVYYPNVEATFPEEIVGYEWYEYVPVTNEVTIQNADFYGLIKGEPYTSAYNAQDKTWTGEYALFSLYLNAGDTLCIYEPEHAYSFGLMDENGALGWDYRLWDDNDGEIDRWFTVLIQESGRYTLYCDDHDGESNVITVSAKVKSFDKAILEDETTETLGNIVLGKRYGCDVTYSDGTVLTTEGYDYPIPGFLAEPVIITEPDSYDPTFEVTFEDEAKLQWYEVKEEQLTVDNTAASPAPNAYYDETNGIWIGAVFEDYSDDYRYIEFFHIELNEGDVIKLYPSEAPAWQEILIGDIKHGDGYGVWYDWEEGCATFEVDRDSLYCVGMTSETGAETVSMTAVIQSERLVPIADETESTLSQSKPGATYVCIAEYDAGFTLESWEFTVYPDVISEPTPENPTFEVTHSDDAEYQWYQSIDSDFVPVDDSMANSVGPEGSYYDPETGLWHGDVYDNYETDELGNIIYEIDFFVIELNAGDILRIKVSNPEAVIRLYNMNGVQPDSDGYAIFRASENTGVYLWMYSYDPEITVSAEVSKNELVPLEGQNSATLTEFEMYGYYKVRAVYESGYELWSNTLIMLPAVTKQPTSEDPSVEVNFPENVERYEWREVLYETIALTGEHVYYLYENLTGQPVADNLYDPETGYFAPTDAIEGDEDFCAFEIFSVDLQEGDIIRITPDQKLTGWDGEDVVVQTYDGAFSLDEENGSYIYRAQITGPHMFLAAHSSTDVRFKAELIGAIVTDNIVSTESRLSGVDEGKYVCRIIFDDGSGVESDIIELKSENEILSGDVDGDGKVDQYDYIYIKRHVMGTYTLSEESLNVADVTGDGKVDQYDYILIKRHAMGTYTIG